MISGAERVKTCFTGSYRCRCVPALLSSASIWWLPSSSIHSVWNMATDDLNGPNPANEQANISATDMAGAALLVVIGKPTSTDYRQLILDRITEGKPLFALFKNLTARRHPGLGRLHRCWLAPARPACWRQVSGGMRSGFARPVEDKFTIIASNCVNIMI